MKSYGVCVLIIVAARFADPIVSLPPYQFARDTLLDEKLIEEVSVREDMKPGHERRRYYRLTSVGRKLAHSEADRLAEVLRLARRRKILQGAYV
jgi:hypothetical protein